MIIFSFATFGLIIGSFLNVVILRHGHLSIFGRSSCPACGKTLEWFELFPVLSWLVLRGACRSCNARISIQYPLVELSTATLFALIGVSGLGIIETVLALFIVSLFIAIFVYDLYYTLIPDSWSYTAAFLSLLYALSVSDASLIEILFSGPLVALPLYLMWFISRGRWMGLGDAKLALALGWLLGLTGGVLALLGAFILGSLVSIFILLPLPTIMLWVQKLGITSLSAGSEAYTMKSEVPFGPFLIASCLFLWFLYANGYDVGMYFFGY